MKVLEIRGDVARAEAGGLRREISLALLENVSIGQYVIVHAGFAIEKLDQEEAMRTLRLFDELAEAVEKEEAGRDGEADS